MHGITHLLSHHGSSSHNHENKNSPSESNKRHFQVDAKLVHDLSTFNKPNNEGKLYLNDRQASRGSVSSTYSYGSSTSYGSSHGSSSSNYGSGNPLHHNANQSVYHTIHGTGNHGTSGYHHQPLHTPHQTGNFHQHYYPPYRGQLHPLHGGTSSGTASPTSTSPTGETDKQHHHHHHHHHGIHDMIRFFGKRIGHIRRQSESQDSPKEKEEEFRNRSQSLDGSMRPPTLESDCETTYRIYESILRQGKIHHSTLVSVGNRHYLLK